MKEMPSITVLIEGYATQLDNGWKASSTTCLVTSGDVNIITDPGCNREVLLQALEQEGLTTDDIDFVFLSHRHPDHIMLAGIFENAVHITFDAGLQYNNDLLTEFDPHVFGEGVEIISTPGHVLEHLALVVDTDEGKVAIAGDVIWWLESEEQVLDLHQKDHSDAIDMDMKALVESRKKLIAMADYIIPGHGKKFKVDKRVLDITAE